MLDIFYLAIGCMFLVACRVFTKSCNKLEENKNAPHHCRNNLSKDEMGKWDVPFFTKIIRL